MISHIRESVALQGELLKDASLPGKYAKAVEMILETLKRGGKVLVAGNGGSAADAQHFAAEFVATFKKEKRNGYPVLALTTDTSYLTAWANDFDYADIFAREVQTWGKTGDVFIGISTSGNSENIFRAMGEAKKSGLQTVGLLGNGGGKIKGQCDIDFTIPSASTAHIQEMHMLILHALC